MNQGDAETVVPIRRAILSVSEKTQIVELARGLHRHQIEIFSTGGTRHALHEAGIAVQDISSYTGFPELMDGRLKTLHPKVFGGILARRDRPDDLQALSEHGICSFDLIVVNLYPFEQTVVKKDVSEAEAIEQIDIGGPSLIRAAAKNFFFTAIVTDPEQYDELLAELTSQGGTTASLRRRLAEAAFRRTADYDQAIATYFARSSPLDFPASWTARWQRRGMLRYGENPHQAAALYQDQPPRANSLLAARPLGGKELSYNNYLDLDAALRIVRGFPLPTVTVIKHTNPCGLASAEQLAVAADHALAGDPVSAFGGIVGLNRAVDVATAEILTRADQFIEAILAPSYEPDALQILTTRPKWKSNVRLLALPTMSPLPPLRSWRQIDGGMLVQDADRADDEIAAWKQVTSGEATDSWLEPLAFAWRAVRHVHSNAIVVAKDRMVCGVGAGQMSRVDAVELALRKAAERARGAVMASDAFFPFPDSIVRAAEAGISAIVQPGGSRNDQAVIDACNQFQIPMYFTDRRHFLH